MGNEYIENNPDFEARSICSRFVHRALKATCPAHQPVIDLTTAKTSSDFASTSRDPVLAEYFTMPDDIWRAVDQVERFRLKG